MTTSGSKGEICPGRQSATTKELSKADAQANFTEGKGAGKNMATFRLSTLPGQDSSALKAAYAADQTVCAKYKDATGLYVVRTQEGPSSVTNADELLASWSERIYYDRSHRSSRMRDTIWLRAPTNSSPTCPTPSLRPRRTPTPRTSPGPQTYLLYS